MKIIRKLKTKQIEYAILSKSVLGSANYTFGFLPIKIRVYDSDREIELKQTNWFLSFINALPILNIETFTPFALYYNGKYIGKSQKKFFQPIFLFKVENSCFELQQYNDNFISLKKNGEQIALYSKEHESFMEQNKYDVDFDKEEIEESMILLFCIFIDMVFYHNYNKFFAYKHETTFVLSRQEKNR